MQIIYEKADDVNYVIARLGMLEYTEIDLKGEPLLEPLGGRGG